MAVDQNVIEAARIVEGSGSALARNLEQQFETIAKKLFPELDWASNPLEFRVADGENVNASIFTYEKPPVIVIDRGLLEFIENEDELAFVIGHEMGHDQIRSKLGYTINDRVTKTEEASADIISVLRGVKAGYSYHAGTDFFKRLADKIKNSSKEDVLGKMHSAVFDPHPSEGNRIVAMELALANENLFKSGTVREVPFTPLQGALADADALPQLQHTSFLDRFLPGDYKTLPAGDQLEWLRKALETTNREGRFVSDRFGPLPRPQLIVDAIKEVKPEPDDVKARAEAEKIIQLCEAVDPYNGKYRFDQFYSATAGLFGHPLPAFGRFKNLGQAAEDFVGSSAEDRPETGRRLLTALNGVSAYLTPEDEGRMVMSSSFGSYRQKSNVIQQTQAVTSLRFTNLKGLYPEAQSSPEVAQVLWQLGGAFDPAFWDVIGTEHLKKLQYVQPYFGSMGRNRHEGIEKLQREIGEKLISVERQAAQGKVTTLLADPEAFIFAHAAELFPKGNPNPPKPSASPFGGFLKDLGGLASSFGLKSGADAEIKPATTPHREMCERIRAEITEAYASGDTEAATQATTALFALFEKNNTMTVGGWLYQNGHDDHYHAPRDWFKRSKKAIEAQKKDKFGSLSKMFSDHGQHYDAYSLEPDHPYAQLLLDVAPHIGQKKFIQLFAQVAEYKNCDEATLATAMGIEQPQTIAEALAMRESLRVEFTTGYSNAYGMIDHFIGLSFERIIEQDADLSIEGENLLALSQLHKQNPEFRHTHLLEPDDIETIHTRLWSNFSAESFVRYAQTLEADQLIDIYQFIEGNNLTPDRETQAVLVDAVKQRIDAMPVAERGGILERLLTDQLADRDADKSTYSVKDIGLRDYAVAAYADHLHDRFGQDTGDSAYAAEAKPVLDRIIKRSLPRDRTIILEAVAVSLNIQAELAAHIHHNLEPTKEDVLRNHLPIVGIEALMAKIERDETLGKEVISYLSDPVSKGSVKGVADLILQDELLVKRLTTLDYVEVVNGKVVLDKLGNDRLNQTLGDLHDNFTSLPIEHKSGILSVLLVPGEHRLDEDKKRETYDDAIQMVFKKAFVPSMENVEEAESFTHAYLETAKDFERPAILAALMALSANNGVETKDVPEQAAQIMCLLGPAYVKLGQAINSHPRTPEDWKNATSELKSSSGIEARWETIRRTLELLPSEQAGRITHFGPVLGAASFNTALELSVNTEVGSEDIVALIERPHAWSRAETGFDHLEKAIGQWDHPTIQDSKATIGEMVVEARAVARVETDPTVGEQQYDRAQDMYAGTEVEFKKDKTRITVTPVSSYASADQIRLISKADGVHFSDLPEATSEELDVKRKVAKAYMALELSNILSGKGFDCDRHGQQMKVDVSDPSNIRVNLYDFGGVDIEEPSREAKKALGRALNNVAQGLQNGDDPISLFEASLEEATDPEARNYLMRTRKAWLALQDFQRYVEPQEMLSVLRVAISQPVDKDVMSEFKAAKMLKMLQFGGLEFKIKKSGDGAGEAPQFVKVGDGVRDQFSFFGKGKGNSEKSSQPIITDDFDFDIFGRKSRLAETYEHV